MAEQSDYDRLTDSMRGMVIRAELAEAEAKRLREGLKEMLAAVGGNALLPGCEEFYRGYNAGIGVGKHIATKALYPKDDANNKQASTVI